MSPLLGAGFCTVRISEIPKIQLGLNLGGFVEGRGESQGGIENNNNGIEVHSSSIVEQTSFTDKFKNKKWIVSNAIGVFIASYIIISYAGMLGYQKSQSIGLKSR